MQVTREEIGQALFDIVQTLPGVVTASRRLKHWADVPTEQRPAVFMAQGAQAPQQQTGQPTAWRLSYALHIYVSTSGEQTPAAVLNPILDAIESALKPDQLTGRGPRLGLAGVEWARIDGPIETSEGVLGDTEVAVVPITVLAT